MHEEIITKVMNRLGFQHRHQAVLAVEATLEVLSNMLPDIDRKPVAGQIPAHFADVLLSSEKDEELSLEEFYERVALHGGTTVGFAMEHAQVVCQVLAESVDEEGIAHLENNTPDEMNFLFEPSRRANVGTPQRSTAGAGHTLADGAPGSTDPVSESDGRQQDSLARGEEPHEDTKLSTSRGTTQERENRTLADGEPGSTRSIS